MVDFATLQSINQSVTAPPPPDPAVAGPAIDVSGAAPIAPTAAGGPVATLAPDGTHHIAVDPNDPSYSKFAGSVLGVSDPQWLPKGITLPEGTKYPVTLKFGALPEPQSFPYVAAPASAVVAPPPASVPARVPPHIMPDGSMGTTAAPMPPADPMAGSAIDVSGGGGSSAAVPDKFAQADAAAKASTKAPPFAPSVPTTGPAVPPPTTAPHYDAATDSMVPGVAAPLTGPVANIAAGGNEGAAGMLGAPVDLATGAINLVPSAINAAAGTNIPTIQNPVGGSEWLKSAMGLIGADPRNVHPAGPGEQLLRSAAAGAISAVLPMAGPAGALAESASPVLAGIGRTMADAPVAGTAASGAAAGVGGTVATDMAQRAGVSPAYMPLINTIGQVAGGGLGAAGAAATVSAARGGAAALNAIGSHLPFGSEAPVVDAAGAPITGTNGTPVTARAGQVNTVAHTLAARSGMSQSDLAHAIPADASGVAGSVPTLGQATRNTGLLNAEREAAVANPEAKALFHERRVQQNEAQLKALRGLKPEDAQSLAAGHYLVNRLNQIDADEAAAMDAAKAHFARVDAGIGGNLHPADAGAALARPINARYGAATKAADAAVALQSRRVAEAADAAGGNARGEEGETARQGYGSSLRDALKAIQQAANKQRRELYAARDPDGKLAIEAGPIQRAAAGLRAELKPEAGDTLTPGEEKLVKIGEDMPDVATMAHIAAYRQNVNAALREANAGRNTGAAGAAQAFRRLLILKQAVDDAEAEATERAANGDKGALAAGAAPEKTVVGRLAKNAADGAPSVGSAVFTPSGRRVEVRYRVVDADKLTASHDADMRPNPAYPAELQPRDRGRAASEAQVARIAGRLNPEMLGASTSAAEGAPIIGPDGVVESGNGRLMAIRKNYADNSEGAATYRKFIEAQGFKTDGMKNPVLVRERTSPMAPADRARFAQEANATPVLAMGAAERAKVDAGRLTPGMLEQLHPGDIGNAANADFVRTFVKGVADKGEEGAIATEGGRLSTDGERRITNALLHKAYGDSALVSALAETGDEGVRAFGRAVTDSAGPMAKLRASIDAGDVPAGLNISKDVLAAADAVRLARAKGVPLAQIAGQADAFSKLSSVAEAILHAAYGKDLAGRLSREQMANYLAFYAEEAAKQSTEARLFGEPLTAAELLDGARTRYGYGTGSAGGASSRVGGVGEGVRAGGNEARAAGSSAPGPAAAGGSKTVLTAEPLTENLTAEDAARFKAADAFNRIYQTRFGPKTPTGEVLATGPGGDFKMALSKVAANFWKRGPAGAEASQHLIDAMGSRAAAEKAIGDYAAFDLRASAKDGDGLSSAKLAKWLDAHADALNEFPELRQKFGTVAKAQAAMDRIQAQRDAIEALNPIKAGQSGADTMGQFLKAGPKGGEAVDAYLKHAGDTPESRAALGDAMALKLRTDAMKNGDLTAAGFDKWKAAHASALDRLPDAAARFDTLGDAQKAVEDVAAKAAQQRKNFLTSAAGHYVTKGGEAVEPQAAVKSLLNSPTAPADAADLVRTMKGDPDAIKGLRLNLAEALESRLTNTAKLGEESEVSNASLQKLVKDARTMRVLDQVFTPDQVSAIKAIAADAERGNLSVTAPRIPGSTGSAAEHNATRPSPHDNVAGTIGAEMVGQAAAHMMGLGVVMKLLTEGAAIAGRSYFKAVRAAGIQTERDLMTQAMLNPELARAILTAAKAPVVRPAIFERIAGILSNLAVSGVTMPQPVAFKK